MVATSALGIVTCRPAVVFSQFDSNGLRRCRARPNGEHADGDTGAYVQGGTAHVAGFRELISLPCERGERCEATEETDRADV